MKKSFYDILTKEVAEIDAAHGTKRREKIIEKYVFPGGKSPRAVIDGKEYTLFNSNDYLGLRFNKDAIKNEEKTAEIFGTGPGAVRFISGSTLPHRLLEKALAKFHGRDDAIVFSSGFATNLSVIMTLVKGQRKTTVVESNVYVISDELNHRSIIDGIRISGVEKNQKTIFKHMNYEDLRSKLEEGLANYQRALVITDGVFSMIGEYADLKKMQAVIAEYDTKYPQGVLLIVDDSHGVGAFGDGGRGCEEVSGAKADVLTATIGKAFGADGGYVVADQAVIDYLREASSTYIYSNSISPSTAAAALTNVKSIDQPEGKKRMQTLKDHITYFKKKAAAAKLPLATESIHPIQPILMGDAGKAQAQAQRLFEHGILVTPITYPVVPPGRDELRVQLNALHTREDIDELINLLK